MPAATTVAPARRSMRVASLARFRYRENGEAGGNEVIKEESPAGDDNAHADDDSSLSDVPFASYGSDIEDAIVGAEQRGARANGSKRVAETTAHGKRKRATTVTALPDRKKAPGRRTEPDVRFNKEARTKREVRIERDVRIKREAHTEREVRTEQEVKIEQEVEQAVKIKREVKDEPDEAEPVLPPAKTAAPRRVRKPAKVVSGRGGGDDTVVEPPADWEEVYDLVKAMRLDGGPAANAAVDTMGCERLAHPAASARDRRFHTLVALMLSSQTKDTVNAVAMARLQAELPPHAPGAPPGLNLENMLAVEPALLNEIIWQVGFHNNKTKYLKQAAEILRDQWGGDIPPTAEGLMALPGVGPKMAYLCLSAEHGWNRVEGIGVDVHVHRITNLWGWQKPGSAAAKTPESTRLALQSWLPRERWKEINWLLVGFGQKVCLPQGAKCGDCTVGLRGLCRSANRQKVAEGRRRRQVKEEEEQKVKLHAADAHVKAEGRRAETQEAGGRVKEEEHEVKTESENNVKQEQEAKTPRTSSRTKTEDTSPVTIKKED